MGKWWITGISGLRRGGPALVVAALASAVLAGAGPAAAAAHSSGPAAPGVRRPAGPAGVISTVAGGVGGPGQATKVGMIPCGVAFGGGHLYIGADTAVRKMSLGSASLSTPAGTGALGSGSSGARAAKAALAGACGVDVDGSGNLVIADTYNNRVRVVAAGCGGWRPVPARSTGRP